MSGLERDPVKMRAAVAYLKDYMASYDQQEGYENYSVNTLIDDVLYGLGVAVWGHKYGNGWDKTQTILAMHLALRTHPLATKTQPYRNDDEVGE